MAANGKEALKLLKKNSYDMVISDIKMPEMNGFTTLRKIMTEMPTPVIMLSSYSKEGAELTFHALDLGAVDFIAKPHPIFSNAIESIHTLQSVVVKY